jgi:hypothetical protein
VVKSNDADAIQKFIAVYTTAMESKSAGKFYYFNQKFFTDLFQNFSSEAHLFTAYTGEQVVASQLVIGNGIVLYDYLRAVYPEYLPSRPNELLLDQISEWAHGAGYKEYCLGGGNTSDEHDSLFRFKKSLSPLTRDFYLYKKVHNREVYERRCIAEGKNSTDLRFERADYFPEYRTAS